MKQAHLSFVFACSVACATPPQVPNSSEDLIGVELMDFESSFDDAGCVCEELLLSVGSGPFALGIEPSEDERLHDFLSRRDSNPFLCSRRPIRPVQPITDPTISACVPTTMWSGAINVSDGKVQRVADGFCHSEFNRCLAQELERAADSLASAPRSRLVRDALRADARARLQSSTIEMASALGAYADGCGAEGWADTPSTGGERRRYTECEERLDSDLSDYPVHAVNHLASGAAELTRLLEQEAQAAALTADALSPGEAETSTAYVESFWGVDGARFAAAQALMGPLPSDIGYVHADPASDFFPDAYAGVYADRVARDERVAVAMRLLVEHEVPFALIDIGGYRVWAPYLELDPAAFYNLLDHRLAYASHTAPYDLGQVTDAEWLMDVVPLPTAPPEIEDHAVMTSAEFEAYRSRALDLDDSPLRHFYGIEPGHVGDALAMMRNLIETMEVEYRTRDQVTVGPFALPAIEVLSHRPRDPRYLAAALQNVGDASTVLFADPLAVVPLHGESSGQIYSFDPAIVSQLGAAQALHIVRVHIARIGRSSRAARWFDVNATALPAAERLITSHVGDVWVEYLRHRDYACPIIFGGVCPGNPLCQGPETSGYLCPVGDGAPSAQLLVNEGRIDIYFDPDRTEFARQPSGEGDREGNLFIVRRRDDVYCLVHGHRPDGTDEGCAGVMATWLPLSEARRTDFERTDTRPSTALDRLGYEQRRFILPDPMAFDLPTTRTLTADAYLVFRTGLMSDLEEDVEYIFVDVIQPRRRASVHALGGRFIEMFVDAFATEPSNPGRPAVAALGLAYDLVPPLEHELISDSDGFEDSFRTYVTNASLAATAAAGQLVSARDFERAARLDDRADLALLAEAEVSETETISQACGTSGGCDLARRDTVVLSSLFIGGEPIVTAPDPDEVPGSLGIGGDGDIALLLDYGDETPDFFTTCTAHLATFQTEFSLRGRNKHDWAQYTESYLSAGLGCARYLLLLAANDAVLRDVPEVVLAELAAGGSGEFRESSGEVRESLILMFGNIIELRDSLREFDSVYTASLAQIQAGARLVDVLTPSGEESFLCHLGYALAIAGAVIVAVVATVASFGTAAPAVALAIVAVVGAVASASAAGVEWAGAECEGDTRPAEAQARTTFANAVLALENLRGVMDRVKLAATRVAIGDAQIDRLQRTAEIASQRRLIRARVAMTNSLTDLPEWHALQSYRVQRARRQLLRAQQYAFIARRSVEYRFGLDLVTMTRSEPFVDPPSTWANDLFVLDTASSADPGTPGVDHVNTSGEAIADWVQQLDDFVRGYPFSRRFRDGTDTQMLRVEHMGLDSRTIPEEAPLYARMMFKCFDADALLPAGQPLPTDPLVPWPVGEPCATLGGVEYGEMSFAIPARLHGYLERRLAAGSFNYRHEDVAFNVVGSAIIDCRRAVRPLECYGDGNLEFSLRQDGLVFVENHDRELHSFMAEPGVILEGRALAAERFLTNPLSAADRALITPFERRELWGRPLMGSFVLRVHGRPEINWRYIDGIQMLLNYRYWTRQE